MLFTIAIPTYNNAKTVTKAIESAINQDYKDEYEVLIVNNASTDETAEVLAQYKNNPKVRIETNESTVDLFANHNVCFEKAKGDYVLFIHSDDELYPYALTILDEKIKQRHYPPRYIVWGHSMFRDYLDGLRKVNQSLNEVFGGAPALRCFVNAAGLAPSGTCYSRKSILEIGGFPPMKSRWTPHDWYILLWSAFNRFEFEMIDRMIFLRTDASTAVKNMSEKRVMENNKEMFDVLFEKLNEQQKQTLLNNILNYGSYSLITFFKCEYTLKERIVAKVKRVRSVIV